jgi:cytochrome P450
VLSSPKCSEKFNFFYQFIDTKNSLVAGSMLHRWPVSRKFCNTSFSPNGLQSMRVKFESNGKAVQSMIDAKVSEKKEFDMLELMQPVSFEIFSEVFLGLSGYEENDKFMDTLAL